MGAITREAAQMELKELMREICQPGWDEKVPHQKANDISRMHELQSVVVKLEKAEEARAKEEGRRNELDGNPEYLLTKEEARAEIARITNNPEHAYWNERATFERRDLAIAYVNRLYRIVNDETNTIEGYIDEYYQNRQSNREAFYGKGIDEKKYGSNELPNQNHEKPDTAPERGYEEKERKAAFEWSGEDRE